MATLEQFAVRIRRIGDGVARNTDQLVRKVAIAVDQAVVVGTPVDTGLARSNWLVSLGLPRDEKIDPYSPGEHLGIAETANASGALSQGLAVIGSRPPETDIYITNNIPYIGKLNEGSSRQAPANFVQMAALAGAQAASGQKVVPRRV